MVVASFSSDAPPSACSAYSSTRSGRIDSAMSVLLCFGGCGVLDCLQLGGTGAVLGAVPVVVLVLGERLHVVRDRGEVGEGLDGKILLLAPRHRELRGEALREVRECSDANAADRLAPVGDGGVGRQLHAPSGPVRVVLSPCDGEQLDVRLGRLEGAAWVLRHVDSDAWLALLVPVVLGALNREHGGARQEILVVELARARLECGTNVSHKSLSTPGRTVPNHAGPDCRW